MLRDPKARQRLLQLGTSGAKAHLYRDEEKGDEDEAIANWEQKKEEGLLEQPSISDFARNIDMQKFSNSSDPRLSNNEIYAENSRTMGNYNPQADKELTGYERFMGYKDKYTQRKEDALRKEAKKDADYSAYKNEKASALENMNQEQYEALERYNDRVDFWKARGGAMPTGDRLVEEKQAAIDAGIPEDKVEKYAQYVKEKNNEIETNKRNEWVKERLTDDTELNGGVSDALKGMGRLGAGYLASQHPFLGAAANYGLDQLKDKTLTRGDVANMVATPLDILASPVVGMAATETVNKLNYADKRAHVDTNSRAYALLNLSNTIEQTQKENIADTVNNQNWSDTSKKVVTMAAQGAYDLGMTTSKAALSMAIGQVAGMGVAEGIKDTEVAADIIKKVANIITLPSYGTSSYAQTLKEGYERGLSEGEAQATAFVAGCAEMLTEVFSLDMALDAMNKGGRKLLKEKIVDALAGASVEGSEEFFNDIINGFADTIINGDKSEYNVEVEELMKQGLSKEDAQKEATINFFKNGAKDFAMGMASGLILQGGASLLGSANTMDEVRMLHQEGNYREIADGIDIDPNSYADENQVKVAEKAKEMYEKLADKAERGETIKNSEQQSAYELLEETMGNAQQNLTTEEQNLEKGQNMTPQEAENNNTQNIENNEQNITQFARALREAETPQELVNAEREAKAAGLDAGQVAKEVGRVSQQKGFNIEEVRQLEAVPTAEEAKQLGYEGKEAPENLDLAGKKAYGEGQVEAMKAKAKETTVTEPLRETTATYNGKTIKINDVLEDGYYATSEGKVPATKVKFNNKGAEEVYQDGLTYKGDTRKAYYDYFPGNITPKVYNYCFDSVYTAGSMGKDFREFTQRHTSIVNTLGFDAVARIYDIAQKENTANRKAQGKRKATISNGVVVDERENTPESNDTLLNIAEGFAMKVPTPIHIGTKNLPHGALGMFKDNTIYIADNTGKEVEKISHEIGEFCKMYNAEGYEEVKQAFIDWNTATEDRENRFDRTNKAYYNRYKSAYETDKRIITPGEATDEVFNDSLGKIIFSDEGKDFVDWAYDTKGVTEANNLLDKVMQFLNDLFDHIKEFISGQTFKELGEDITVEATNKELENLRKSVLNMIDEASRKYREEAYNNLQSETQADNVGVAASYSVFVDTNTFMPSDIYAQYQSMLMNEKYLKQKNGIFKSAMGEKIYRIDDCLVYNNGNYIEFVENNSDDDTYISLAQDLLINDERSKAHVGSTTKDLCETISDYISQTFSRKVDIIIHASQNTNTSGKSGHGRKIGASFIANSNSGNVTYGRRNPREGSHLAREVFSLEISPEETKDLVALHNLDEEALTKTLNLGGFAMPSIAITKKDMGHSEFGKVSVVFGKETIDPKASNDNKVYSGDAWTPTFPHIDTLVNRNRQQAIRDKVENLIGEEAYNELRTTLDYDNMQDKVDRRSGDAVDAYQNNEGLKYAYLKDTGKDFDLTYSEKEYSGKGGNDEIFALLEYLSNRNFNFDDYYSNDLNAWSEDIRHALNAFWKRYPGLKGMDEMYDENNWGFGKADRLARKAAEMKADIEKHGSIPKTIDYFESRKNINDAVKTDDPDYNEWLKNLFDGIQEKQGIRNNKDMFTPSGNRRDWNVLHDEITLENIVRAMKQDIAKGAGVLGMGSPIGASTREFGSIEDIKSSEGQLQTLDQEEFDKIRSGFTDRFEEIAQSYVKEENRSRFGSTIYAGEALCEAIAKSKTKSGLKNNLKKEANWFNYSDDLVDDLWDLVKDIQQMPTGYFESKPRRIVNLDEIKNVILPTDASQEIKDQLSERNIPFTEYEAGNEEDRIAKLNSLDNDVFFSLEVDTEGNELSEGQKEYFKDSKVVDENGALKVMYHGTDAEFNVFNPSKSDDGLSMFFTDDENIAKGYGNTSKVYINVENPLHVYAENADDFTWQEALGYGLSENEKEEYFNLKNRIDSLENGDEKYALEEKLQNRFYDNLGNKTTKEWSAKAKAEGYDGVIFHDIIDSASEDYYEPSNVVVVFDSNQVKRVDNQNPTDNADIRYSLDLPNYSEEIDDLIFGEELSPMLKQGAELLKEQEVDRVSVEKVAKDIIKQTSSEYDPKKLADNLEKVFAYMQSQGEVSYNDLSNIMVEVARPVVEESRMVDPEEQRRYDEFVGYLKGISGVKLSDKQKQEVRNVYGTYADFRNKLFGKLNVSDKATTTLDQIWPEIVEQSAGVLSLDETEGNQPLALLETINALKPSMITPFLGDNNEAAYDVALRILHNYYDQAGNSKEIQAYKKELRDKAKDFRDKVKANYEERLAQVRQSAIDNREKVSDAILKERARARDIKKEQENKQEATKNRESIRKTANQLFNMLEKPTDKRHVPETLKLPVEQLLASIDFVSPRSKIGSSTNLKWQDMMRKLALDLKQITDNGELMDDNSGQLASMCHIIDPDLADNMAQFVKAHEKQAKLSNLSAAELKQLSQMLTGLKNAIVKSNELIGQRVDLAEVAKQSMRDMDARKERIDKNNFTRGVKDFFNLDMLDSITYFEEMGGAAKSILKEIQDGWKNKVKRVAEAQEWSEKTFEGIKDIDKWTGDQAQKFTFKTDEGSIELSVGQLMELYAHSKREQSRGHFTRGGIRSGADRARSNIIHVTPALFDEMMSKLTPEQKALTDKMQSYLSNEVADWGNNATLEAYGYKKFNEKNYWPIKTDSNSRNATDKNTTDNASLFAIRNMSASKNLTQGANNALVLNDAFDTFTDHIAQMAAYEGLMIPLSDAMKWYNYHEQVDALDEFSTRYDYGVKDSIERAFGKGGQNYFIKLMKDINGETAGDKVPSFISSMMGNTKAAAVSANLRVIIQQPCAISRALNEMNGKYLLKAQPSIFKARKLAIEAQDNSMLAKWKNWGYFDNYLGKSMKQVITGQSTLKEKVQNFAASGAQLADDLTWGVLWRAVQYEIADTTDLVEGTPEFNKAVAERFDDIIDRTQVVDTVFNRSQLMRNKNNLEKLSTAFMMEPSKTYNMIHRAITSGDKDKMFRAGIAYILNALITSAAASIIDALRADDDETSFAERYLKAMFGIGEGLEGALTSTLGGNINPLAQIPYIKEIFSAIEGYDASRMDVAWIYDCYDAAKEIAKYANGSSNKTPLGVSEKVMKAAGESTGLPIYQAYREAKTFYNFINNTNWFRERELYNLQTKQPGTYDKLKKSIVTGNDIETQVQAVLDKGKEKSDIGSTLSSNYKMEYNALSKATDEESKEDFKELDANLRTAFKAAGFEDEEINTKLDMWTYGDGKSTTVYQPLYDTFENGGDVQKEVKKLMDSGKEKSQVASTITSHYKDKLIETRDPNLKSQLIKAYMAAGYTNSDAKKKIDKWFEPKK